MPRRGVVLRFADLEIVALNMTSEAVGIDSESLLFAKLQEYKLEFPNLISRRQYNDRRKITSSFCNTVIGDGGYIALRYNGICLKRPISDWKYHTELTRKNGSQHFQLLPKREKELKLYSRNCVTSL